MTTPSTRGNVTDLGLHIAAWRKAALEHRERGEISLAENAENKIMQFQAVKYSSVVGGGSSWDYR